MCTPHGPAANPPSSTPLAVTRQDVVRQLSVLAYVARRMGPIREIPIVMYLISAMFDTLRSIDEYMETAMWKSCRSYINRVCLWILYIFLVFRSCGSVIFFFV